ncbi:hypothetical protein Tco_0847601 [Tanacetum coccineum]
MPTTHVAEEAAPMPYDSTLLMVHSLGSNEGSLTLNKLTVLCTSLSKKVESLESDLKKTKQTYGASYTKLIMKVKKLEHKVKSIKARRKARLVISDDEDDLTQGRSDEDLMYKTGVYDYLEGFTRKVISITMLIQLQRGKELVLLEWKSKSHPSQKQEVSSFQRSKEVARREVISPPVSKISAKDKGKAIMTKPDKPLKKKDQIQSDEELALRLHAEEQAEFERLQKERVA